MARRANGIARTVADHVRGAEPSRDPIGVNDIVRSIIPLVEANTHENGVRLQYEEVRDDILVFANRTEIESVVLNLVRNAVEAMENTSPGERRLKIQSSIQDGFVAIAVSDTGCGMDPGVRDNLFEPYFTTKPDGIGMGLAISRTIIEAHGGTISCESSPGGGMTVRFTLPVFVGDARHDS